MNAWNQEFYAEGAVLNCTVLPDQLIETIFRYCAVAVRIYVYPMICARSFAVDRDAEADWLSGFGWAKNQMKITGVKAVNNST